MSKTEILNLKENEINHKGIDKCAEFLKQGKLVVFPTETVYGLGANALSEKAVKGIFKAKERPSDNPLIVHISDKKMLSKLVKEIPEKAKKLMDKFWPGPLTIIMKKNKNVPNKVTAFHDTVAIRMPSDPIALYLIKKAGLPVAAPSANISGKPSITLGEYAISELKGKVDCIINRGTSKIGLESTVIDITTKKPIIYRPGFITKEDIEETLGEEVIIEKPDAKKPKCPGMKYRHYAPKANLLLIQGKDENEITSKIEYQSKNLSDMGKKVAIIASKELSEEINDTKADIHIIGHRKNLNILGNKMFNMLRELDNKNYEYILIGSCPEKGLGLAIMNRLRKAATRIM